MDIWAGVTLYIDLDYINVLISKTGEMVIEMCSKMYDTVSYKFDNNQSTEQCLLIHAMHLCTRISITYYC